MRIHSGSLQRVDRDITTETARFGTRQSALLAAAAWALEILVGWVEAVRQRGGARRAAEAEARRMVWWRAH